MNDLSQYVYLTCNGKTFGNWQGEVHIKYENIIGTSSPFDNFAKQLNIDDETYNVQLILPKPDFTLVF